MGVSHTFCWKESKSSSATDRPSCSWAAQKDCQNVAVAGSTPADKAGKGGVGRGAPGDAKRAVDAPDTVGVTCCGMWAGRADRITRCSSCEPDRERPPGPLGWVRGKGCAEYVMLDRLASWSGSGAARGRCLTLRIVPRGRRPLPPLCRPL